MYESQSDSKSLKGQHASHSTNKNAEERECVVRVDQVEVRKLKTQILVRVDIPLE